MVQNILITGGAGYIGGSLIADILSRTSGPIKGVTISTAVRSEEQVRNLSKLGITVLQLDLADEAAVLKAVLDSEIDIVVHTASSMVPKIALHLIRSLGRRRKATGNETYFIHSSVLNLFSIENMWPYGEVRDTDSVFEKEKQLGETSSVRADYILTSQETNILVVEEAKSQGVTAFNVPVPTIYGRGTGVEKKLSASIPAYIRTSIKNKTVHKFEKDSSPPAAHISDMTDFYVRLVEKILRKESIPSGENGYYFVMAHRIPWWTVMQRIVDGLHARGLVEDPRVQVWSSYETAAEQLGFPPQHVKAMGTCDVHVIPVNAFRLGWQPQWDEKRFLGSIDDEIQAVQELDTFKPTIFDAIMPSKN